MTFGTARHRPVATHFSLTIHEKETAQMVCMSDGQNLDFGRAKRKWLVGVFPRTRSQWAKCKAWPVQYQLAAFLPRPHTVLQPGGANPRAGVGGVTSFYLREKTEGISSPMAPFSRREISRSLEGNPQRPPEANPVIFAPTTAPGAQATNGSASHSAWQRETFLYCSRETQL